METVSPTASFSCKNLASLFFTPNPESASSPNGPGYIQCTTVLPLLIFREVSKLDVPEVSAKYVLVMLFCVAKTSPPEFEPMPPIPSPTPPMPLAKPRHTLFGASFSVVFGFGILELLFATASLNAATAALCFPSTTTPDVLASKRCVTCNEPGIKPSERSTHPGTHSHPLLSCACDA